MATSGGFSTSKYNSKKWLYFYWTRTDYDVAANTSTIYWSLSGRGSDTTTYHKAGNFKVVIDGKTVYSSSNRIELYDGTVVADGVVTLQHNSDGTRSFSASAEAGIYEVAVNCKGSSSWSLEPIPRAAELMAVDSFTEDENPLLTYYNSAGDAVDSLQICITLDGTTADIPYREVEPAELMINYEFELTSSQRNILINAAAENGGSCNVGFYLMTTIGSNRYFSKQWTTFSLTGSAESSINPTVYDTNEDTVALTGDDEAFIRYYSDAYFNIRATAGAGSTIESTQVTCGSRSSNSAKGTLSAVESATFKFTATDSRGNTMTKTIRHELIEYVKLTCNMEAQNPDIHGAMALTISGNYFDDTFGEVDNSLTVQYRYKTSSGSYTSWKSVTPSISGNSYTATANITGLSTSETYTFQARATDELATVYAGEQNAQNVPVYDWGKNDFSVNVDLYVKDRKYGENKILWAGNEVMDSSTEIELDEGISRQPHGIVLVFSSASGDVSFNTAFVSKKQVELFANTGHTFLMGINAGFSKMGAKYLYFTDTTVTGHSGNTSSGSNSGISYDNTYYALRYVIGV